MSLVILVFLHVDAVFSQDLDPHRLTMRSSDSDPKFLTLFQHLDNFHDNSASFRDYLTERIDLSGIAKRNRLALRTTNTVTPRVRVVVVHSYHASITALTISIGCGMAIVVATKDNAAVPQGRLVFTVSVARTYSMVGTQR